MDHKEAAKVLISLMKKHPLSVEESDAVSEAIGVLSWTSLSKGRIMALKAKKEKESEISG